MKIIAIFVLLFITIAGVFMVLGCSRQGRSFGQPITETALTPIGNILAAPGEFAGKTVKIEGKITDECPAGGWVFLKDESGVIYVNLHPSYFAIPQLTGHKITAQGVVRKEGTQLEVIGEGVEVK